MSINKITCKYTLPTVRHIRFTNFDLYTQEPNANVKMEKNVLCLIGANGLGKSTFLNTLSYAVTGIIPNPNRKFLSAKDYFDNAKLPERTSEYFTGRISTSCRETARSEVKLVWPDVTICVTRDFFQNQGPIRLVIQRKNEKDILDIDGGYSAKELEKRYIQEILKNSRLADFEQFVFLVHFVMTFDESRHLMMWDESALTTALYLVFGEDSNTAREEEQLRRNMEREDSRSRNVRFAARKVRDRKESLQKIIKRGDDQESVSKPEIQAEYERLIEALQNAKQKNERKQEALRDTDQRWTEESSRLTKLRIEYQGAFSERLTAGSIVEHHPTIRASISENSCAICNTLNVAHEIKIVLQKQRCPLCNKPFDKNDDDEDTFERIREIDQQIARARDRIDTVLKDRDRIEAEAEAAKNAVKAANSQLESFMQGKPERLNFLNTKKNLPPIEDEIEKLQEELDKLTQKSIDHRKNRDEYRKQLRKFEISLKEKYSVASGEFVSRFRELAEAFIGLNIDIKLNEITGANKSGFSFGLYMNNQLRQRPDELSESQRFFIDIALRMTLAEFITDGDAVLLIDTPEGSLDIAYEAKVGEMFFLFVEGGNQILMTSNLKISQLILRLAKKCQKDKIEIVRMIDWSKLTDVQIQEEKLFEETYKEIEKALVP